MTGQNPISHPGDGEHPLEVPGGWVAPMRKMVE